jgi:hypothetical protein
MPCTRGWTWGTLFPTSRRVDVVTERLSGAATTPLSPCTTKAHSQPQKAAVAMLIRCRATRAEHLSKAAVRENAAADFPLQKQVRCPRPSLPVRLRDQYPLYGQWTGFNWRPPAPKRLSGGGGLAATVLLSVLNPAVLCPACSFGSASRCFGRHDGQRTRSGRRCGRGGEQALLGETRWHHFQPPTPPLFSFSSPLDVGPCANRSEPSRSSYGLHLPEVCIGWTSTRPGLARVSKPCSR